MVTTLIKSFIISSIILFSSTVFAEDIMEPESLIVVDSYLSSINPQDGVDHHVIRVCENQELDEGCTQCIYKATADGRVKIPTYNRCIFRPYQSSIFDGMDHRTYELYFQVKAVAENRVESTWTKLNRVIINKYVYNSTEFGSAGIHVTYYFD